jgi:two-component system, OmpR family, sensor histidine kinase KdpD
VRARASLSTLSGVVTGVGRTRRLTGLTLALVGIPVGTALLIPLRDDLALATILLLYLLAIVVVAAVGGLVPGVLAAVLSFGLAYWFFTPPFHTVEVRGKDALVDLLVFGVVAGIVSATVELAARDRAASQRLLAEQTARARELAAADRVRSALLAAVGHDLRTPLTSITAAVSALRQPEVTWSAEQRDELLGTIEESSDRLRSLVTNLVDMTRLRADAVTVRLGPVALDEIVARALLRERRQDVDIDVDDGLPRVLADAVLLERVVENLVENAVRFTPTGCKVEVRADVPAAGEADGDGRQVARLHVVDHGPGVPAERRTEMFSAFRQLDDRGPGPHVGLGLAIVQGFTEAMGARVAPSETPGGGLTMTVSLPVAGA